MTNNTEQHIYATLVYVAKLSILEIKLKMHVWDPLSVAIQLSISIYKKFIQGTC